MVYAMQASCMSGLMRRSHCAGTASPSISDHFLYGIERLQSLEDFRLWTREAIRPLLPHQTLACRCDHLDAGGVVLDGLIAVDYPSEPPLPIRTKSVTSARVILRRWLAPPVHECVILVTGLTLSSQSTWRTHGWADQANLFW